VGVSVVSVIGRKGDRLGRIPGHLAVIIDAYANPKAVRELDGALQGREVEYVPAEQLRGAVDALHYLAFGVEMLADGTVRVLPGALTHEGVEDARRLTGGQ
jgi:hypothetical protein